MPQHRYSPDHDACGVGFVAQFGHEPSHDVVKRALAALLRLAHRGGLDADGRSGDGAGLLLPIPQRFIRERAAECGVNLPEQFGLGMMFATPGLEAQARQTLDVLAPGVGLRCLGWRPVPVDAAIVGPRARDTRPAIWQCFLTADVAADNDVADLENLLFRLRKQAEAAALPGTYFCSLSSRTVVYKGLLTPDQLAAFYPDLADPAFEASFAVFHQRYSTNTQPSWSLAQPFRFVAHNGEINTISANRRWLTAKQADWRKALHLPEKTRLLEPGVSDSASLDNCFELYVRRGFGPESAMHCMVPPAWETNPQISPELRHFLDASGPLQEPWDGPAALIFTDGEHVGAKLDRNGLRPLRYTLTEDGMLVVGSEVGIADLHGKHVIERQRLGPGEMLLANPCTGEFVRPSEIGCRRVLQVSDREQAPVYVTPTERLCGSGHAEPRRAMAALGWTEDQYRLLFQPLVDDGQEAVWSMGDDAPPAFMSRLPRPVWDYCKQRFAQVTNPPIDPLRETHVMSLRVYLSDRAVLSSPLLDAGQLERLESEFALQRVDIMFAATDGVEGAKAAMEQMQNEVLAACQSGGMVLLSDRGTNEKRAALPALLVVAAAWKSIAESGRWQVPLLIETGQVIDTHHIAMLVASGASAVFPYLALEQASTLRPEGVARYRYAVEKGLRKVMARMGVSTMASYRNSQLFEVIGLERSLCDDLFEDAGCVPGTKSLSDLLEECLVRHRAAYVTDGMHLQDAGLYRFRQNGERHATSPKVVRRLHRFIKSPSEENFRAFSALSEDREPVAIRDLLEVKKDDPLSIEEVETEASLLSRFSTQAMSLGAISPETHRTLAIAMNRLGGRSNTGEGGEDPQIYTQKAEANNRVKQVASARFGVTTDYLVHADELEIKIAQGAKPGEGGQLPASKVTAYIARLRHAVPNMMLISPPPHHDIYSIEDLAQLIYDLRAVNPRARIGVKLVSSAGVGIIATGVAKAGADVITIAGHDGGTGASPITSIKTTGLPWEIGLRDAHCSLVRTGLRGRVRLRADGGFKFARDVIIAALLGAEEFGFGTAALLAIGCVMARQCHLNTCPVGIATQDEKLRARFIGNPEMVETYFRALANDVRAMLADMGATSIDEIVGAADRLQPRNPKDADVVGTLLVSAEGPAQPACPREKAESLHLELAAAADDLDTLATREHRFRITNSDLAIGAHLSGEILRRRSGAEVTGEVACEFTGSAGQSFGAFLIPGVNFRLLGEANDYVGKGLSGGSIAITAGEEASRRGDVLVGNTVLYGATSGELYVAGRAGERFAVRNSGALAVVEGVGQHACEYMTAGVVVTLGPAGMNLGAGMTGGVAYVLRESLAGHGYNSNSVHLLPLEVREELWLRRVLRRHLQLTGSPHALILLASDAPLPLLRVQPVRPPGSIEETWTATLARLRGRELAALEPWQLTPTKEPLAM
jgi:glutamate synthase domain-containing protein 2/glutamate synthase domain-containing protein 1/glutamate synthase domain-containing protein 3